MNDYSNILTIHKLISKWTLSDWSKFRTHNNYWDIKNRVHKQWYDRKRSRWNNRVYSKWLEWKLETIQEYVLDN